MSDSDVVYLSEDAPVREVILALVAKSEGKTVKVIKKTETEHYLKTCDKKEA